MARWAAIVGARGAGKSTHARVIVGRLRARGVRVGGFLQLGKSDELGRTSYDLLRLSRDESLPLARPSTGVDAHGETSFCSFAFVERAFEAARGWIAHDAREASVLFVDEVSKMEAAGQGHHDAIRQALAFEGRLVVLCIRADQLFYVVEKFELEDDAVSVLEVPAEEADAQAFVDAIVEVAG